MPRKTRSDARLPKLTKEQRETLLFWLDDENLKLSIVVTMIYDEFGIRTNKSSVSDWYSSYCFSREVRAAAELAGNLKEELAAMPGDFMNDELVSRAAQARFESLVVKDGDLKGHVALRTLRQKDRAQAAAESGFRLKYEQKDREIEQRERQIELDREKFETNAASLALQFVAELKTIATNRGMTEPARIDAARKTLFGVDPTAKPAEVPA